MGHYCPVATTSPIPCPAGTFGNTTGLGTPLCSGLCQAGYICNTGSVSSMQTQCGDANYYCPTGTGPHPYPVSVGYYTFSEITPRQQGVAQLDQNHLLNQTLTRSHQAICPLGSYCTKGIRRSCPPGTYGDKPGLATSACAGNCPLGHYCPLGSTNGTAHRCPAGRYGGIVGLGTSACSGRCMEGYYCLEGSTTASQFQCGTVSPTEYEVINRVGTFFAFTGIAQQQQQQQQLGVVGNSAMQGPGLAQGQGLAQGPGLALGYINSIGLFVRPTVGTNLGINGGYLSSLSPRSYNYQDTVNGAIDSKNAFLEAAQYSVTVDYPEGSPVPGDASTTGASTSANGGSSGMGVSDSVMINDAVVANASRALLTLVHPEAVYCPSGSPFPSLVTDGYYTVSALDSPSYYPGRGSKGTGGNTNTLRTDQLICPMGSYCLHGVANDCPAGRYGRAQGLSSPQCSGACSRGFWCRAGSTSRQQELCPRGTFGAEEGTNKNDCETSLHHTIFIISSSSSHHHLIFPPTPLDYLFVYVRRTIYACL